MCNPTSSTLHRTHPCPALCRAIHFYDFYDGGGFDDGSGLPTAAEPATAEPASAAEPAADGGGGGGESEEMEEMLGELDMDYLKELCKELGDVSQSELVARVEKAAREAMGVEGGSAGAEAEDEDGSDRGGFSDGSGSGSDDDVPKGRPDWFDACLY